MYLDLITAAPAACWSPYAPSMGDYLNDRLPEGFPFNSRYTWPMIDVRLRDATLTLTLTARRC